MNKQATYIIFSVLVLLIFIICQPAQAIRIALVNADSFYADSVKTFLVETGQFTDSEIDIIDAGSSTPSLSDLSSYEALLIWSNYSFYNPTALGDVLADYVDAGGGVVLATFSYSSGIGIDGRILNTGYSPFSVPPDRLPPSGVLDMSTALIEHPIMAGVTEASYWVNPNYSDPPLTIGSTLIAKDTDGHNVVAINARGDVAGIVIFPGHVYDSGSTGTKTLFANALKYTGGGVGAINGHVTDTAGEPLRALVIAINADTKEKTRAVTDVDGYYEIPDLELGTYWVICIKRDYKLGIRQAEVVAGEVTTVNFKLRRKQE